MYALFYTRWFKEKKEEKPGRKRIMNEMKGCPNPHLITPSATSL